SSRESTVLGTREIHKSISTDQRHSNADRRNDGSAPILQKNKNYVFDERNRLDQGGEHVFDGFADGIGRVEGELVFHSGREALAQPLQFGDGAAVNLQSVSGG